MGGCAGQTRQRPAFFSPVGGGCPSTSCIGCLHHREKAHRKASPLGKCVRGKRKKAGREKGRTNKGNFFGLNSICPSPIHVVGLGFVFTFSS